MHARAQRASVWSNVTPADMCSWCVSSGSVVELSACVMPEEVRQGSWLGAAGNVAIADLSGRGYVVWVFKQAKTRSVVT